MKNSGANNRSKKKMPFATLMGIFAGTLVAIIIVAVVVIKAMAPTSQNRVVSKKVNTPAPVYQPVQESKTNAIELQEMQKLYQQQSHILRQSVQQQQNMTQRLESISSGIATLEQRVATIESSKTATKRVEIVKPERIPRASKSEEYVRNSIILPVSSGYKVQATVGKRAWITAGEVEESVTVGEVVPPIKSSLYVHTIDAQKGLVITSTR